MPTFNQAGQQLCSRCQQPLPEGSGYCVSCGFSNGVDALHGQKLKFNEEMNKAHERRRFWDHVTWFIWGWSRLG